MAVPIMLLSDLYVGESGRITSIEGNKYIINRLVDDGFKIDVEVKVLQVGSDGRTYGMRSGMAGLREREAKLISVEKISG